jgi:hypothetical protein
MSTKITKQKLPEWFNGELYEKGDTVRNRFSGEEYKLSAMELSMYDYIIGATTMMEMGMRHDGMIIDLRKGLDWFKQHNAEAYMVLLD